MFLKLTRVVAIAAAVGAAVPAAAAPTAQDVRCFLLSNLFAQKNDKPEGRLKAQASAYYYLGKLQGMSDADLRRTIAEQNRQITVGAAAKEMGACVLAVQASGQHIQSFAPARPAQPAPAPTPPRK